MSSNQPGKGSRQAMNNSTDILDIPYRAGDPNDDVATFLGRAWTRATLRFSDCVLKLDEACLAEVQHVVTQSRRHPLPILLSTPEQFEMPKLRTAMCTVRSLLNDVGVAVVDRLALSAMTPQECTLVYFLLSHCIDRPVAQKWDGTMLYDVTDKGLAYGYGVRGSYTNVELLFHTDNAFGLVPPNFVGLFCLQPARSGGVSRFCSLSAIHNRMRTTAPQLLARLYCPMLWDRQAEHAPGAAKISRAPMFHFSGDEFIARANPSLVRKAYDLLEDKPDSQLDAALSLFQTLTEDAEFWIEAPIDTGQLQFLNNRSVAHYRSAFEDAPHAVDRRHLVRTWHRAAGRISYDG